MSDTIVFYSSTDASAPTLSGTAGSLIALLDACLVNGYGAKASLGWSKAFTGTNQAVYRSNNIVSNRFYLAVDETGGGAGGQRDAAVRGYEVMTSVTAGTGLFPTVAQAALAVWTKSSTADATVRAWMIFGNDKTFYVRFSNGSLLLMGGFGHFTTFKPGDGFNTFLAWMQPNGFNTGQRSLGNWLPLRNAGQSLQLHVPRPYTQAGTAVSPSNHVYPALINDVTGGGQYDWTFGRGPGINGQGTMHWAYGFPTPIAQTVLMAPIGLLETVSPGFHDWRGVMPGLFQPLHDTPMPLADLATFNGTPTVTGNIIAVQFHSYSGAAMTLSEFFADQSGPW